MLSAVITYLTVNGGTPLAVERAAFNRIRSRGVDYWWRAVLQFREVKLSRITLLERT